MKIGRFAFSLPHGLNDEAIDWLHAICRCVAVTRAEHNLVSCCLEMTGVCDQFDEAWAAVGIIPEYQCRLSWVEKDGKRDYTVQFTRKNP